jgi:hypothetical protein
MRAPLNGTAPGCRLLIDRCRAHPTTYFDEILHGERVRYLCDPNTRKERTVTGVILKAASIITMDPANARAQAISFNAITGVIAAVGSVADC